MSLVVDEVPVKWIAGRQVGMGKHQPALPPDIKFFLLSVYLRYGWAAVEGMQFLGCYDNEADARWAANCEGGWYRSVPYNTTLPFEMCQFGTYDHPQSESSSEYRNRQLPFVVIPRSVLEGLDNTLQQSKSA